MPKVTEYEMLNNTSMLEKVAETIHRLLAQDPFMEFKGGVDVKLKPKTIDYYVNKSMNYHDCTGLRGLAREIGVTAPTISGWQTGFRFPTDANFLNLIRGTGEDPVEALLWLQFAKNRDCKEAQVKYLWLLGLMKQLELRGSW